MAIPKEIQTAACLGLERGGGLSSVRTDLTKLAVRLTQEDVTDFYLFLRNHSYRWEVEWRKEFSEIFCVSEAVLPKPDQSAQWSSMLHHLIELGDLARIRLFVDALGIPNWNLGPMDEGSYDIYPLDDPDEIGETPVGKASRLGFYEIATYLKSVRNTVLKNSRVVPFK